MKNLKRLMEEFSILGMAPNPLDAESEVPFGSVVPPVEAELEYELDAEGNPLLDAEGNPIPKAKPEAGACTCNHREGDLAAATTPATGGLPPSLQGAPLPGAPVAAPGIPPAGIVPQLPPEDEFDFKV